MRNLKWRAFFWGAIACVPLVGLAQELQQKPQQPADEGVAGGEVPKITAEQPMSVWMERKLGYSQEVLKALAMGDFASLELNAERMRLIGRVEAFARNQNPQYAAQLRVFDLANRELTRQARKKNIEGATLAFQQLTGSCVACHITLREPAED